MKKNKAITKIVMFLPAIALLSGCGNVKNSLGLQKDAPDEFAVVRHAPLEMPPNIALPPPRPGAQRPQEQTTTQMAQETIFGHEAKIEEKNVSSAEQALLQQTGVQNADPDIRNTIDAESEEITEKNQPVIDKLLGKSGIKVDNLEETLDPVAEAERLRTQQIPTPEIPKELEKNK